MFWSCSTYILGVLATVVEDQKNLDLHWDSNISFLASLDSSPPWIQP